MAIIKISKLFNSLRELFLAVSAPSVWVPSNSLLYLVLIVGAFLTAGVALSALSFYEDFYWKDKDFRDQLRLNSIDRVRTATKK